MLYGKIVNEVISNSENLSEANDRLQKIGFRIGTKIVDQFMRDTPQQPCTKLKELAVKFCTVGVRKFLTPAECKCQEFRYRDNGCEFRLRIVDNPLLKYVEVPSEMKASNIQYQSIIKGAIRGAFEILGLKATITIIFESIKEKNQSIFYVELTKLIAGKQE